MIILVISANQKRSEFGAQMTKRRCAIFDERARRVDHVADKQYCVRVELVHRLNDAANLRASNCSAHVQIGDHCEAKRRPTDAAITTQLVRYLLYDESTSGYILDEAKECSCSESNCHL